MSVVSPPIKPKISLGYKRPIALIISEINIPKKITCTEASLAPFLSFSPILLATTAVAAILKPIAKA